MRLQRRGGLKLIMTPEGAAMPKAKPRRDEALIKALVRDGPLSWEEQRMSWGVGPRLMCEKLRI